MKKSRLSQLEDAAFVVNPRTKVVKFKDAKRLLQEVDEERREAQERIREFLEPYEKYKVVKKEMEDMKKGLKESVDTFQQRLKIFQDWIDEDGRV